MKTLADFLTAYGHVLGTREAEAQRGKVCRPPIVLSRQAGSGGRIIAERVAQRLGFAVCDKQILDELATRVKVPREFLAMLDERPVKAIELLGASLLRGVGLTPHEYERVLKSGLRALLKLGSVVIIGRGASFVADPGKVLRVRVVAPFDVRVRNFMRYENLSEAEAARRIQRIEKERAEFVRRYFGAEEATADCFDIALNTQCLDIDTCVDLICVTYERMFKCAAAASSEVA